MLGVRITLGGHATVLIELDGTRLLTDPLLRSRVTFLRAPAAGTPSLTRSPDAVLLSHFHRDHLDSRSLRLIEPSALVIGPPGTARRVARSGLRRVVELRPGEHAGVGSLKVSATGARHGRLPGPLRQEAIGFLIEGSKAVYFAGDTDLFPEMADLASDHVDVALLPVAGWGPRLGAGHLDSRRAAEALRLIRPQIAVPIHWGFLRPIVLGSREPRYLTAPGHRFAELAATIAPDVTVRVLGPGEVLDVP